MKNLVDFDNSTCTQHTITTKNDLFPLFLSKFILFVFSTHQQPNWSCSGYWIEEYTSVYNSVSRERKIYWRLLVACLSELCTWIVCGLAMLVASIVLGSSVRVCCTFVNIWTGTFNKIVLIYNDLFGQIICLLLYICQEEKKNKNQNARWMAQRRTFPDRID